MGTWTPNILLVMYALTWYRYDGILSEQILVCECRVVLHVLDVGKAAMVSECLVEHSTQHRALIPYEIETQDSRLKTQDSAP